MVLYVIFEEKISLAHHNLIYTEGANFGMMTRQLGNNTVKEEKNHK